MLQIKNTLGGGKPNAPYAWAKYNTIENPIYYINPSFTAKVITAGSVFEIVTSSFDASKVDTSFFEGFEFDVNTVNLSVYKENEKYYISKGGNLSIPREFTYDPTTMRFNINNLSDSTGIKLPLNGGNYTGNKPTGEYEIFADSLIEYIIDDSPNKYPNGEVHTDGFFYRYAPEGLYAWKKYAQIKVADDTQTKLANMPTGGYKNSAVSFDGKIYVFGSDASGYGTKVQKYDSESNSWSYGDDMPYSYLEGSAVVYNNKVHILGGYTSKTKHYSFDGTTWTSESTLPYQFFRGTACVYNNKIHILGGYLDSGTNNGLAYHYSWDGSEWKQESTLPYSMRHGACTVYNGKIHLLGGYGATSNHYSWDGSSWYNEGNMSNGTYCAEAHTYRNCIYVFGGMYASTSLYKWDGSTWSSITLTSKGFALAPSVIHNDNLYIMGSNDSSYIGQFYKILGYKNENVFLDYIVSDKETAYPDGGEKDGYWYERVLAKGGDYIFSDFDAEGYPATLKINTDIIPASAFACVTGDNIYPMLFSKISNLDIKANSSGTFAFGGGFYSNTQSLKIKIRVGTIESPMFDSVDKASNVKAWLSNEVTTIKSYLADFDNAGDTNIYCEASSKPSGWNRKWNIRYLYTAPYSTMWGVSESDFDAL